MFRSASDRWVRRVFVRVQAVAFLSAVVFAAGARADSLWIESGDGNWDLIANWMSDLPLFPNTPDETAAFTAVAPIEDSTITLNLLDITVGTIQIDNPTASVITGRTLTFDDSVNAEIQFNSGTWTIESDIVLDSDLTITGTSIGTVSGSIGDGTATNVTKSGTGLITLSGENTFSGTLSLEGGTLSAGSDANLGAGNVAFGGGVLRTTAGITSAKDVSIGAGGATIDTNGFNSVFSGVFDDGIGTAGLAKTGEGTLTLTGINTYEGATIVDNGRLIVNGALVNSTVTLQNGAMLGGSGVLGGLTVQSGSAVAPGNSIGTMSINGAYVQAAGTTYEVEINDSGTVPGVNNDVIQVIGTPGTATLNGGTVDVQAAPGNYAVGTTYTIITTTGGVIGTYDNVMDNLASRNAVLLYTPSNVQIQLQRIDGNYSSAAVTTNQNSVAGVLDDINPLAVGDMGTLLDEMIWLTPAQQQATLDQVSGELHASTISVGLQSASMFNEVVSRQLRMSSPVAVRRYAPSLVFPITGGRGHKNDSIELAAYSTDTFDAESNSDLTACTDATCYAPLAFPYRDAWSVGYGSSGEIDSDGNAAGLDYSLRGSIFGLEQQFDPLWKLGMVGGYSRLNSAIDARSDEATVTSYKLGAYGYYSVGKPYTLGILGYGFDDYETRRRMSVASIDRIARANYHGHQFTSYLERGADLIWKGWQVQPFAGLQYTRLYREEFTESGSDALNLAIHSADFDSLRFSLGGRVAPLISPLPGGVLIPEFRARWVHEFLDDHGTINAQFAGAPGERFIVHGVELGRDFGVFGVGLSAKWDADVELFANYDLQTGRNLSAHAGSCGLQLIW